MTTHRVVLLLLLPLLIFHRALAEEMSCCSWASGSCRSVCSKISLVSLGADPHARENATRTFSEFCSSEMVDFWYCVNSTIKDMERNENWTGRSCCRMAQSPVCRRGCAKAGSRGDLRRWCRWSDEPDLADCLEEREEADQCCASVEEPRCREACHELFKRPGKGPDLKRYTSKGCFHQMPKCLKSHADPKHTEDLTLYLHCCDQAQKTGCQDTCRRMLHSMNSVPDMMYALEEACGPVMPHSPLWSCMLTSSPSTPPPRLPLAANKLACCLRATRDSCKTLCWRAFQSDWAAWQELDSTCLSSSSEGELRRCLEDADEACEMGCSGLSFCSRFNDRSTTLFRSCTAKSDEQARFEADRWLRGGRISGLGVPVRPAPGCSTETLKAAACLLQLRPCESRLHETLLCREDCMELMTNCVDWSAVEGHNAATLCARLAPPKPDMPCVSIKPFLEEPRERNEPPLGIEEDINMPCKNEPCPNKHICEVRPEERNKYRCVPGCPLGERSKQLIPIGSWAQIPRFDKPGCYRVCQCSTAGELEKCRELRCPAENTCWVQSSLVEHFSSFYLECKPCRCLEGEVTCSRRSCAEVRVPQLPCDCPDHYVPVCGRLGATYASACLAKCAGLPPAELEYNSCSARDPCASRPCQNGERCIRRTRVCLSQLFKPCEQYECVPLKCNHRDDSKSPVCDTENRQHSSLCSLIRSGGSLAYRGPCLRGCGLRGPVCGINGETYASECAAWAERTIVDYRGPCIAVGLVSDQPKPRCGSAVQCPALARPNCIGVTPPGACCPVCAGAARLFYSKKQLDKIYYVLSDESDRESVTLESMLSALSRQLEVSECALRGALTPEGDIFVLAIPMSRRPSELQLAACVAEIEKLVTRVAERSAKVTLEVPLSALTRAELAHSRIANGVGNMRATILVLFASTFIFYF